MYKLMKSAISIRVKVYDTEYVESEYENIPCFDAPQGMALRFCQFDFQSESTRQNQPTEIKKKRKQGLCSYQSTFKLSILAFPDCINRPEQITVVSQRAQTTRNEVFKRSSSKQAFFCERPVLLRICICLDDSKRRVKLLCSGRRECVL